MSLYTIPCRFCQEPITDRDYDSIPAHVLCVSKNDCNPVKNRVNHPIHHDGYAKDTGCAGCGKKHKFSKRRRLKKGWVSHCMECERSVHGKES